MTRLDAIGFDLDMTLVDSRPVSQRALERLVSEYGADLNIETLMSAYGLPLSRWLPADIDGWLFRALQAQDIALAAPTPGAHEALAAVRDAAARTIVVTYAPLAIAAGMLQASGLHADRIRPGVWAAEKAEPIREEKCWAFVGDHADDMLAARQAGVIAIGVNSGTSRPRGAQVELDDLSLPRLASVSAHAGILIISRDPSVPNPTSDERRQCRAVAAGRVVRSFGARSHRVGRGPRRPAIRPVLCTRSR